MWQATCQVDATRDRIKRVQLPGSNQGNQRQKRMIPRGRSLAKVSSAENQISFKLNGGRGNPDLKAGHGSLLSDILLEINMLHTLRCAHIPNDY
jgi:hypothetical protein